MERISYAMDFASFLMQNLKNKEKIKSIILFGSVARDESEKESDIDIFIDVFDKDGLEKEITKIKENFLKSVKFLKYWKLLGIKNDISIIIGKIEDWKLKDSMLGNSIVLYEHYKPKLENGKNMAILGWNAIKKESKRVILHKKIFGYNYYGKFYHGLLGKFNGRKLGSNTIIFPIEHLNLFLKLFKKFSVAVKIYRIFEYES